jgi:bla regulator protein BlaR1
MILAYLAPYANHIWQSTVFAAFIALLALALRKQRAGVRHGLWLCASLKFLIPFSLLTGIGATLDLPLAKPAARFEKPARVPTVVSDFMSPAPVTTVQPARSHTEQDRTPEVLFAIWLCGFTAVALAWTRQWLRVRNVVRSAKPFDFPAPVPVKSTVALMEPGVFGIFRPVLLLPDGIADRLSASELSSVLTHEMHHVERRDNLWAALHMMVEAIFWFHPLVWWMESTLVAERERACDEEVVRRGSQPEVYAEGILKVCEHYLQSPQLCVAGVSGSDLRKRIDQIMTARIAPNLGRAKKTMLAMAGIAAIGAPVIIGAFDAPSLRAQSSQKFAFEVASVKPTDPSGDSRRHGFSFLPGGRFQANNLSLQWLIAAAYDLPFQQGGQRIIGLPDWAQKATFDIEAVAPKDAIAGDKTAKARQTKIRLMVQTLLAERFHLVLRHEMREMPVYAAVLLKGPVKLEPSKLKEEDCPEDGSNQQPCHEFNGGMGRGLHAVGANIEDMVTFVSNWSDRPILDRTGLKGLYKFETPGWAPMNPPEGRDGKEEGGVAWADRPTLFTIFTGMGLKLEAQKLPVEFFIVEHAEPPAAN